MVIYSEPFRPKIRGLDVSRHAFKLRPAVVQMVLVRRRALYLIADTKQGYITL